MELVIIKILVGSDSPNIPSGFAQQMKGIATHLSYEGYDVGYLGWQTKGDITPKELPFKMYGINSQFGKEDWENTYKKHQPDIMISLGDAHMVNTIPASNKRPLWFMYYPLDGDPISQGIGATIRRADIPIAMAHYGYELTQKELGITPEYIPHFYHNQQFFDRSSEKDELREKWGMPADAFVIGSVARMNPRKHHGRLLYAFRLFLNMLEPEEQKKTFLYLHLDPFDALMWHDPNHNYQFVELIDTLGLQDHVIITPNNKFHTGIPVEDLNEIFNTFDFHTIATGGEGFGVPFLEASATGVPNVATDYTTTREHVYLKDPYSGEVLLKEGMHRGIAVPYSRLYMELSQVQKGWVDVPLMADAFYKYYDNQKLMKRHGLNAKKYVNKYYTYEKIMNKWDTMLDRVYDNIELKPLKTQMRAIK